MKRTPDQCHDMQELRAQIDQIDQELMVKLAERATYIDRAAQIKATINLPARIDARVEEVVENAKKNAAKFGFDPELAAQIWREMIEWSIAREDVTLKGNKNANERNDSERNDSENY